MYGIQKLNHKPYILYPESRILEIFTAFARKIAQYHKTTIYNYRFLT